MTIAEKLKFLQESHHLNDWAFCTRFRIKISLFKKWKAGTAKPQAKDIQFLCNKFHLDSEDFISDSSTLASEVKANEHPCKVVAIDDRDQVIYEDYVREDNSRYEEKD